MGRQRREKNRTGTGPHRFGERSAVFGTARGAARHIIRATVSAAVMAVAVVGAAVVGAAAPALAAPNAPAAAPSSVQGASVGATALRNALTQQGKPYVWGAAGPNAYDCSGLVQWAFKQAAVNLPHNAAMQSRIGTPVSREQLQPGDLVFFYSPVEHVGIYVGDGKFLNAPTTGQTVKISSMAGLPFHNAMRL